MFPKASAVGHCQRQDLGISRTLVICLWLFLWPSLKTLLLHCRNTQVWSFSPCAAGRLPCIWTGWSFIWCEFKSSSLTCWQGQTQPMKGDEGKQRNSSFIHSWKIIVFLQRCVQRISLLEEVTFMKWLCLQAERLQNRSPFEQRSQTQVTAPWNKID